MEITAISKPHWLSLYFRLVCNTSLAVSQEALNFHAFSRSAVVVDLKVSCRAFNVSKFRHFFLKCGSFLSTISMYVEVKTRISSVMKKYQFWLLLACSYGLSVIIYFYILTGCR